MKTIWHWNVIGKHAAMLLAVVVVGASTLPWLVTWLSLPTWSGAVAGLVIGVVSQRIAARLFGEGYHFE